MLDVKSPYEAKDVADAINTLVKDSGAEIISGGTDVLIRARERKDARRSVVSIHSIEASKGVRLFDNGGLWMKAGTAFSYITNDVLIQGYMPILRDAVGMMDGPQICNTGTTGDNVCNGAISAGPASIMQTLEADVLLEGPEGKRTASVCEFYTSPGRTIRQRAKVCTGPLIHKSSIEGWSGHYIKYGKGKAMEIATLGYAVRVKLSQDREWIEDVRLGHGMTNSTPLRCYEAEHDLERRAVNDRGAILALSKAALEEVNPRPLWRVSKEFRLQLIGELPERALAGAIKKAGGAVNAQDCTHESKW